MRRPVPVCTWRVGMSVVGMSFVGLLLAGTGCGSSQGHGGPGGGGQGGSAGTTGAGGSAGTTGGAGAGGAEAGTSGGAGAGGAAHPLGLNDVTILAPLPASLETPLLVAGSDLADDEKPFVPRALYDRLAGDAASAIVGPATYDRLQLVAVRFDLCDRHLPGACPAAEDGRLRLVFQPLFASGPSAQDVGFHAFYAIRNDELAGAVAALRALAESAPPPTGPLRISPALAVAAPEAYKAKLRAFVKRYGGEGRLVRLTMNAQPEISAQIRWVLRGVEKHGDLFADMTIVGSTALLENVVFSANASYQVTPGIDVPSGLQGAITETTFTAADAATQRDYLASLAAVDNPLVHTAETVACATCHVATAVMAARATSASIDPLALPGRYTSASDLSTAGGKSAETPQTIRAFGYLGTQPLISQRVVNETAQVLAEIAARFP